MTEPELPDMMWMDGFDDSMPPGWLIFYHDGSTEFLPTLANWPPTDPGDDE